MPRISEAPTTFFLENDVLPLGMSDIDRETLVKAGVKFGEAVPDNDMFCYVQLPYGWTKRNQFGDMHFEIIDHNGDRVAEVIITTRDPHAYLWIV